MKNSSICIYGFEKAAYLFIFENEKLLIFIEKYVSSGIKRFNSGKICVCFNKLLNEKILFCDCEVNKWQG